MTACTEPHRLAPIFTPQEQLTLLLIGCRHAEALANLAKGPSAERAALAFAREVLRSLKPVCPGLRHPVDLEAALIELRQAMRQLQRQGATWWGLPGPDSGPGPEHNTAPRFDAWLAKATVPESAHGAPEAKAHHPPTEPLPDATGNAAIASSARNHRTKGPKARRAGRAPHVNRQPQMSRHREGELS